jgi:hypothetical protein
MGTLELRGCTFRSNHVLGSFGIGGAVYGYGGSVIVDCLFVDNSAAYWSGAVWAPSSPVVNSRFHGNHAANGGALTVFSNAEVINCVFSSNSADDVGGAIFQEEFGSGCNIRNSTFYGNSTGSGHGAAIGSWDTHVIHAANCIFWSHEPEPFGGWISVIMTHSNVEGGHSGEGNIDADPLFIDPDGPDDIPGTEDDNLRLAPLSPCIDAADNGAVPPDILDLDGDGDVMEPIPFDLDNEDRFVDAPATADTGPGTPPIVDMGAYEYQTCPADINNDEVVDVNDLLLLLAAWDATSGPGDINHDGIVDVSDLLLVLGTWGPCP